MSPWVRAEVEFSFNTQPPEGGCAEGWTDIGTKAAVSIHSRPKAAGRLIDGMPALIMVSIHSRPKAAGLFNLAGGGEAMFQYTAARRRLLFRKAAEFIICMFQYTAARRRLKPIY